MNNILGNIAEIAGIVTALATAGAVYVAKKTIDAKREDDRRTARLNRINQQLSQLYGKLSILYEIGMRDWCSFIEQHGNDSKMHAREFVQFFPRVENNDGLPTNLDPLPPNAEQLKAYRKWLKTLFTKTNEKMLEVIYTNADLVIGKNMPPVLILFAQHVSSMRLLQVTLEEEELKVASGSKSTILDDWKEYVKLMAPYPGDTGFYIGACFEVLKEEQEMLLSTSKIPFSEMEIAERIEKAQRNRAEFWNSREVLIKAERAKLSVATVEGDS
jgi:hypothetical protein